MASKITFTLPSATHERNLEERFIPTFKDFGAKGDGVTDDTANIQAALDSGVNIFGNEGEYRTTDTLTFNSINKTLFLAQGCKITLDTTDNTKNTIQINDNILCGGELTTTNRTLNFIIKATGKNALIDKTVVSYATKSTIAPINGVDIPYNRGGVALHDGATALNCEIYNQEGAGIVTYGDLHTIDSCHIHDNVLGIHATNTFGEITERTVRITNNDIYDNDVNHAEGASGVLTSKYTNIICAFNRVSGSGEHGMYVYSPRSTLIGNQCYNNYRVGLKIKATKQTNVSDNICWDNATSGETNLGELEYQLQGSAIENSSIKGNTCFGHGRGIRATYMSTTTNCSKLNISDNNTNAMYIAFSSDVIVSNNMVDDVLSIGDAQSGSPAQQENALVVGNMCDTLMLGRSIKSKISTNTMRTLTTGTIHGALNIIDGNKITDQQTTINRGNFSKFHNNEVECSSLTTSLLAQAVTVITNSDKEITNNNFKNHSHRIIDDTTSSISGDNYILTNNKFDSSVEGISMWGSNHIVNGNRNVGGGGVGYIGSNNSYLVANSPMVVLRSGTVGNVLL
jgi:hypothetical protein